MYFRKLFLFMCISLFFSDYFLGASGSKNQIEEHRKHWTNMLIAFDHSSEESSETSDSGVLEESSHSASGQIFSLNDLHTLTVEDKARLGLLELPRTRSTLSLQDDIDSCANQVGSEVVVINRNKRRIVFDKKTGFTIVYGGPNAGQAEQGAKRCESLPAVLLGSVIGVGFWGLIAWMHKTS